MPRGHGKVSDRSFTLSRRSPEQSSCKCLLKENQVLVPVLRSNEQRCVVIAFRTLDVHLGRSLAPFASFSQWPKLKNEDGSLNKIKADMPDNFNPAHSLPAILFHFDLSKEQSSTSTENPALSSSSAKTIPDYQSSSRRLRQKRSFKNSPSNSLATSSAPTESARPVDGVDLIDLDILADTTSHLENPSKQILRKKGKKKRKQHKRSMRKNVFSNTENQGEVNSDASVSEASVTGGSACSVAFDNSLSTIGACPSLLVQDASDMAMEKLDMDANTKVSLGKSSRSISEPLYENICDSTTLVSLPNKIDDASLDKVSVDAVTSCSNPSSDIPLLTSQQSTSEISSAKGSDCCEVRCSMTTEEFNPLVDGMISTSRNVFVHRELYDNQVNHTSSCCSVNSSYLPDASETECRTERDLCSSPASTSDDFHPVIRTKRGRIARTYSGSSDGMNKFSKFSLRGGSERENKHPQWQKIPKNITAELPYGRNDKKLASQHVDLSANGVQTWVGPKRVSGINLRQVSSSYDGYRSTYIYSENLRRKTNSTTEQGRYHSLNACLTRKNIISRPSKTQIEHEEGLETAPVCTSISQKTKVIDSSSRTCQNSWSAMLQPETITENICNVAHDNSLMPQEVFVSSSMTESNLVHSHATEQSHGTTQSSKVMNNSGQVDNEDEQCHSLEVESAHLESDSYNSSSGYHSPKWIPTGRKDMVVDRTQIENLTDCDVHGTVLSSPHSSISDEFLGSVSRDCFPLSTNDIQVLRPSSQYMDCSSPKEIKLAGQLDCHLCTSSGTSCGFSHPSSCLLCQEPKEQLPQRYEADLIKIVDAVTESYKLVIASEEVHLGTGSLAQIERVLNCVSPVLETGSIRGFRACSQNEVILNSTCVHQVPSISLQRLWQWYEKPGSYGLEVKLEELHASKRSHNGLSEFCAYFAPYLSAVQLFARSRKAFNCHIKVAEGEMLRTCKAFKLSDYLPCAGSVSTFSELPSQDCKGADTWLTKLSSTRKFDEQFSSSTCSEHLDDGVLLFEYFDSDQPQQRRPLFNKIKELVQGDSLSNCHFFGDPSKLESLNLEELHPASWYAVAWYPIYRIPDGTFRAAFLTYHSFGNFIYRKFSNSITSSVNSLILPVVGLQSYNAKGEWFEPINSTSTLTASQTDATFSQSPSEILRERLLSLERTACVMSRASVVKGDQKCTNRHPDFEFFLSRKW